MAHRGRIRKDWVSPLLICKNLALWYSLVMPITQSAKKALRQSKKRNLENLTFKRKFKSTVKELRKEVAAKSLDKAKNLLPTVYQAVDKAAKKGVIKKNTASRYKSRLSHLLNKSAVK